MQSIGASKRQIAGVHLCILAMAATCLSSCKQTFHVDVQNYYPFTIRVVRRDMSSVSREDMGSVHAGSLLSPIHYMIDDDEDYILLIEALNGSILGEVRQSREQVQHTTGHIWHVTVPHDLTTANY